MRRSPDLLNTVKIGQDQLQLILEQILFNHIWGLQPFWPSDLNNLMNIQSNRVASSIPARSHTFVEIDHEIISTVILLPSADSFKKGCCQLQAKVCARITGYRLVQACPGKSVVR